MGILDLLLIQSTCYLPDVLDNVCTIYSIVKAHIMLFAYQNQIISNHIYMLLQQCDRVLLVVFSSWFTNTYAVNVKWIFLC